MIDIDIKAIRAAAESIRSIRINTMVIDRTTALALCDEIERLRKDAARYQLLKRKYTTENDNGELRIEFECGFDHWNDIDAAIDAEIGKNMT